MNVFERHNIKTVVHVGANVGEELEMYTQHGVESLIFFEPRISAFQALSERCQQYKNAFKELTLHNVALGTTEGKITMYVASNGQSSSILKPKHHLDVYPNIIFNHTNEVNITRGDKIFNSNNPIDFLHIDVQGYELEVLKGFGDLLENIKVIECEANIRELYEGCALLEQVDEYLSAKKFVRIFTPDMSDSGWGDCIYEKVLSS